MIIKDRLSTSKYFFRYICSTKKNYFLYLIAHILLISVLPIIDIVIPKFIIDELMGKRDLQTLSILVGILITSNFVIALLTKIVKEQRTIIEDWFARDLEMNISRKTMLMRYDYTERSEVIEAEKKAETGISWYSGGVGGLMECIINIFASAITLIGIVYIVFDVSFVVIIFAIIAVIVNSIVTAKCNQAQQEVFKITPAINKFYYYIYQKVTDKKYAKEIRLFDASDMISKKAKDNADSLNEIDNNCAKKQTVWGIIGVLASTASIGFSYFWLGFQAVKGLITIAELTACIAALDVFTNKCLNTIIRNVQEYGLKCNFMSAYVKYMGYENSRNEGNKKLSHLEFESLEFENVSFTYPGTETSILDHISFKLNKGECLSIVGLNGAGKTTIVKLICRLYKVTSGDIKLNGNSIYSYDYDDYINCLSVVFQDFKLFGYSIDENITIGAPQKKLDKENIYELSGIRDWVDSQELKGATLIGKDFDNKGVEPSGGVAQKIAIARALHRDSEVIILDEPTAALDPKAEYEIYSRFKELTSNKTAIYISHRLSSCKFCDRIIVLDNKRISEEGTHEQLICENGLYASMYNTQANWYI